MTFVQVKYAGQAFTEEDELNGIAFQGTGSGTLVDYIQVHNNSDDGVEFFGGATNAKHVLLTGNEDDALDWTQGWNGKMQFVAIRQTSASEHCIEADSNSNDNDAMPRANAVISNMTCAGPSDSNESGFRLRQGTSAQISNTVVGNFGSSYCVDIDHSATFNAAGGSIAGLNGSLTLSNSRLATGCNLEDEDNDPFRVSEWFAAQTGSMIGGVDLGGGSGLINGHMLNAVTPAIPADSFFDQVDYIGAIKDETSDWTAGWVARSAPSPISGRHAIARSADTYLKSSPSSEFSNSFVKATQPQLDSGKIAAGYCLADSFLIATNPDCPFPLVLRTVYPYRPRLNFRSLSSPERAETIFSATGSMEGASVCCLNSHLPKASSARSSPMDLRSAFSFLICPLLNVFSSKAMLNPVKEMCWRNCDCCK